MFSEIGVQIQKASVTGPQGHPGRQRWELSSRLQAQCSCQKQVLIISLPCLKPSRAPHCLQNAHSLALKAPCLGLSLPGMNLHQSEGHCSVLPRGRPRACCPTFTGAIPPPGIRGVRVLQSLLQSFLQPMGAHLSSISFLRLL